MACGTSFAKCLLTIFNIIFLITGLIILGLALWVRLDEEIWDVLQVLQVDDDEMFIEWGTYLLIAVGGLILVAGIIGFCGTGCHSRTFLILYCVLLGLVMLVEIAAAILVIIFRERAENEVMDNLKDTFEDDYDYSEGKWSDVARAMNVAQFSLECCGINDPGDYAMKQDELTRGEAASKACAPDGQTMLLPATCFELKSSGKRKNPDDVTCDRVHLHQPQKKGCEDELLDFFEGYAVMFIATALVFAALEIFGLVFAICLIRSKRYKE